MSGRGTSSFTASVFIAASVDGYIATPDGELDWLTRRAEHTEDTGYEQFMASVDAVATGRNTHEKVLTFGERPYDRLNLTLTTAPVILGEGIPLFGRLGRETDLRLEEVRALGGTQARYSLPSARTVINEAAVPA